ncbi:DUF1329 domain-containing protein [Panacagrimonas sp.]|uniref:DUF1329 domain-containing protein n=1 Tax=Panacagrimonas sp. TaxID=2480088 RepID=UPI003B5205F3
MRIRKYDFDYSRRVFMDKVAKGAAGGVLAPLWPTIANSGEVTKAYPDELLSIEMYTKGKIKPGDIISVDNVEVVKDLLDPICFKQVKEMGRKIKIREAPQDATTMFNHRYLELTLKNQGRAKFDATGNLWMDGKEGQLWDGGLPFPDAQTAQEACSNISNNWGRHDYSQYPIPCWSVNPDGHIAYKQNLIWFELQTTGRNDGQVFKGLKDLLRLNTALFTGSNDVKGSSFLSVWYYDQRKFPDLYGYFPAFKRVRQFPTNQRFEPLVPGMTLYLTDAWGAGDPLLTWGNFKIIERKPMLGPQGGNWWAGYDKDWAVPFHGGPKGTTFFDKTFELIPECIVWDSEPTGYPRAPVSRRRTWSDARNGTMTTQVTYDRRGELYKQIEFGTGQMKNDKEVILDAEGKPDWSWHCAQFHDIQTNRMTLIRHYRELDGYKSLFIDDGTAYDKYMTTTAVARLGQ